MTLDCKVSVPEAWLVWPWDVSSTLPAKLCLCLEVEIVNYFVPRLWWRSSCKMLPFASKSLGKSNATSMTHENERLYAFVLCFQDFAVIEVEMDSNGFQYFQISQMVCKRLSSLEATVNVLEVSVACQSMLPNQDEPFSSSQVQFERRTIKPDAEWQSNYM